MPPVASGLLLAIGVLLANVTAVNAQTVVTSVGTDSEGSNVGGTGPTTSLSGPGGVHAGARGVYIADTGNNRILRVDDDTGVPAIIAGTGDAGFSGDGSQAVLAELNGPTGVFVVSSGNVYIVDSGNHRIRLIDDESGVITTFAGNGEVGSLGDDEAPIEAQLSAPSQVFVTDDEDSVFIADTGNHRIRLVTGSKIATFAGTGVAGFFGDDSLAVQAQLSGPSSVSRDSTSGRVYIADTNNHRIRFVSSDTMHSLSGTSVPSFGGDGGPPAAAQLAFPKDVFADREGNVYVADTFNQRVRRVNRQGTVTTVVGDGVFGFDGDGGPANHAQMRSPANVFVDSLGWILVADRDNHRIRRIDPDNVVLHGGIGAPDRETALLSIGFTGDGVTSVESLGLTLFGYPHLEVDTEGDPIRVDSQGDSIRVDLERDFVEFRLYESSDAAFGSSDVLAGSTMSAEVMLGVPFTIELVPPATPSFGVERHYLVTALVETTATEHDFIWAEFATGDLVTSTGGRGMVKANPRIAELEIDVLATRLVFSTQPAGSISGIALSVPPVIEAWDSLDFIDTDFTDVVTLTTNAAGTLHFNTVAAIDGIATFPNLAYVATADEEAFALIADDEVTGLETDLGTVTSEVITSSSVNDQPIVTIIAFTMFEDGTATRQLSEFVTDPDDTDLTIEVSSDHLQVSVENEQITFVPEPDFSGAASLTIIARDAFGAQGQDTATIEVIGVNDPPVLNLPSSLTISEDDTLTLDLTTIVVDPDNAFADLDKLISPSPGLDDAFDQATGVLKLWTAADSSGSFTVTITVSDETSVLTETLELEIVAINDQPEISNIPELYIESNSSTILTLDAYVTDDQPIDLIAWTIIAGSGVVVAVDSSERTAEITSIPGFQGTSSLFFIANDREDGADSEVVEVTVLAPGQQAPLPAGRADFDGSGRVDLADFFLFADVFGLSDSNERWDPDFDLDDTLVIDFQDFFLFADVFGATVQ